MAKGLQDQILEALASFSSYEQLLGSDLSEWAMPGDIRKKLGRENTAAIRVALSKALKRLHERGLVARASGEVAAVGQAFRHARINDPKNAGAGSAQPHAMLRRPKCTSKSRQNLNRRFAADQPIKGRGKLR